MKKIILVALVLSTFFVFYTAQGFCQPPQTVNVAIIAQIESGGDERAISYKGAEYGRGACQISEMALTDWNVVHLKRVFMVTDLYNMNKNLEVADWYANKRIPDLLSRAGLSDTLDNRLAAYNWGIGNVVKSKGKFPASVKKYIKKYKELEK